eukprot:4981592-Prymnesium_polylepis.2
MALERCRPRPCECAARTHTGEQVSERARSISLEGKGQQWRGTLSPARHGNSFSKAGSSWPRA